ncbi:MAG TPA: isopentenyl-diphosphate Delta-isomerase [Candidatus Saccharimonadales bacterium]|nr:isopentenyl-diphosphate Delta-isomerase [Candidatus Saccharimonadales bacterium]
MEDIVVLVDKNNTPLGTASKLETHNSNTPLHRGFSVFLFNSEGKLLLQQRAKTKKTFPLVWSNSCCGHPKLDETSIDAAKRHLNHELNITDVKLFVILPDYRYKTEMNGIWENEICPVLIGFTNQEPKINKDEVENIKWIKWEDFLEEIQKPNSYSAWSVEEAKLLSTDKKFLQLFQNLA